MTDEEIGAFGSLQSDVQDLTVELRGLVELEKKRHDDGVIQSRRHEDSDNQRIEADIREWNSKQKFFSKHGGKIASVIFSAVVGALTWYGAEIRGEVKAEERAKDVDTAIKTNTDNFAEFKESTEGDLDILQMDSINNTIMMDNGFERIDTILLKGFGKRKLKKEDLPDRSPLTESAKEAKCIKRSKKKGFDDDAIDKACRAQTE